MFPFPPFRESFFVCPTFGPWWKFCLQEHLHDIVLSSCIDCMHHKLCDYDESGLPVACLVLFEAMQRQHDVVLLANQNIAWQLD